MATVFVIWLVLILVLAGLFLIGGVLTTVGGGPVVWFLLTAAALSGAVFLVLRGLERLQRLEDQLQAQARQLQRLEERLERREREPSARETE